MADSDDMPSTTFSPVSNAGLLLNWAPHQVAAGGAALAWMVLPLTVGMPLFSARNIPAAIVLAVSLVTIRGRSLWQILAIRLGFGLRRATAQTRWTTGPMARDTTVGYLDLPGATGRRLKPIALVDTRYDGACFLWDGAGGEATAVLRMAGTPFLFRSGSEQAARGRAWSDLMSQAVEMQGVTRIVTQARCLAAPYEAEHPRRAGSWSARQLAAMEAGDMRATPVHDMILSVTVSQAGVAMEQRRAGGGEKGMSQILRDRVVRLVRLAVQAGASPSDIVWLNAAQVRGLCKTMTSPDAWGLLNEWDELPDDIPVSSSFFEFKDRVEVDQTVARTLWIDQWPTDPVSAGFLQRLVVRQDMQCILTQTWRPRGEHAARKALDNRVAELERIRDVNRQMGRNTDMKVERELEETQARLRELAQKHVEVDFQGFFTVLAPDRDTADRDVEKAVTDMGGILHFDRLRGQQWAAWVGALPLGQAGR